MDFAMLPPEINSGRMYAGPGSGPMLAASAAWDDLAETLHATAAAYGSVISGLIAGPWLGPASASMAAATAPYTAWMSVTGAQAEEAAMQAKAAAVAYETAFAATVPPPVIAANRALLMALVATNIFGQNTPAIAATETQYAEMWAQDAAAMYGYAGSSASATTLTPFTPPAASTNPSGLAGQAGAVARASGMSAATNSQGVLSPLTSAVPTALQGLASPLQSTPAAALSASGLSGIVDSLGLTAPLSYGAVGLTSADLAATSGAWESASDADGKIIAEQGEISANHQLVASAVGELTGMEGRIMGRFDQLATLRSAVSAALGQASAVGALSVPQAWTVAAPAIRLAAVALPTTGLAALPAIAAAGTGSPWAELALAGMAGRAIGGPAGPGLRTPIMATVGERAAPPQSSPGRSVLGVAAELRELAALRDSGILTDEEFSEQKRRVLA